MQGLGIGTIVAKQSGTKSLIENYKKTLIMSVQYKTKKVYYQ